MQDPLFLHGCWFDFPRVILEPDTDAGRAAYFAGPKAADRSDFQPLVDIWRGRLAHAETRVAGAIIRLPETLSSVPHEEIFMFESKIKVYPCGCPTPREKLSGRPRNRQAR